MEEHDEYLDDIINSKPSWTDDIKLTILQNVDFLSQDWILTTCLAIDEAEEKSTPQLTELIDEIVKTFTSDNSDVDEKINSLIIEYCVLFMSDKADIIIPRLNKHIIELKNHIDMIRTSDEDINDLTEMCKKIRNQEIDQSTFIEKLKFAFKKSLLLLISGIIESSHDEFDDFLMEDTATAIVIAFLR